MARKQWKLEQPGLDASQLIFLDETGLSTNMTRARGRTSRGERCVASAPHGHWKTTTFIAGLRAGKITATWLLDGPMDGEAFLIYVRRILCPTLTPHNTVILDNLSSHKVAGVIEAIQATGAETRYLPAYSPDLNPIEKLFSKIKAHLRKAEHRNVDDLWKEVGEVIQTVEPPECANYFKSSGYVCD